MRSRTSFASPRFGFLAFAALFLAHREGHIVTGVASGPRSAL